MPSASNLDYYIEPLVEAWRKRKLLYAAQGLLAKVQRPDQSADALIAEAEAALSGEEITSVPVCDGKECATRLIDHLEYRFNLQGKRSGLVTGFRGLDHLTDGLQFCEKTIIAARPSQGKTAIGLNIVDRVCLRDRHPTLVVSCEMSKEALCRRLLSSSCELPMNALRSGQFTPEQFRKFTAFGALLKTSPLYILDAVAGIDVSRLTAVVRRSAGYVASTG